MDGTGEFREARMRCGGKRGLLSVSVNNIDGLLGWGASSRWRPLAHAPDT